LNVFAKNVGVIVVPLAFGNRSQALWKCKGT